MSDRMHPIPFEALLDWILGEYRTEGSIFGVRKFWHAPGGAGQPFMGRSIESAVGPAAGPHTQLAQNIVAAYLCGGRVFELKTVQVIDGVDLRVSKPCILAGDEGYNCEWSTELTVPQARDEYIKAWVLLHVLARELPDDALIEELTKPLYVRPRNAPTRHRAMRVLTPGNKANCRDVCGICASVCPNRANVIIAVDGKRQMLHIDGLCNECGNCASFCAEKSLPYRSKLTVFADRTALEDSQNAGFAWLPEFGRFLLRWAGVCREVGLEDEGVPEEIRRVMAAVRDEYPWLLYR